MKKGFKLFEQQKVRTHWDEKEEKWYFSVIDVISILTESANPRDYWFKMQATDGIMRETAFSAPRMGGTLIFCSEALKSLQPILIEFGNDIKEDELRISAHPHPISGAMDFQQRLEFLKFHIDRHYDQASNIINAI